MKEKKFSYHWIIVFCVFVLMAITVGFPVNCFSVFAPAWVAYFGCSTSTIQIVNMLATFATALSCLFLAKVMSKMGFKKAMIMYSVVAVVALFARSTATSIPMLIVWSILQGFGLAGCSTVPGSILLNTWFAKDRGTATGIAFTGSVAGGLIFVQICKNLVANQGWQKANFVMSVIAAVCLLVVVVFLVKEKPADKGLLPYGMTEKDLEQKAGAAAVPVKGISKKAFMKTPAFWLYAIVFFLIGFCNMGMQNNTTLCLINQGGFEATKAADIFSVVMFIQIFGKILLGKIYDKKGIKFAAVYNVILYIASTVFIILSTGNVVLGFVFGAFFGMMCSMTTVTPPYVLGSAVGQKEYSGIYGVLNLIFVAGAAIGPIVVSAVYDKTGSYTVIFCVLAALSVLGCILTIGAAKKCADNGYATMD